MTSRMIAIAAAVMALASGGAAQAGFVVNISQVGNNVVATGSGTIDTTALGSPLTFGGGSAMLQPNPAQGNPGAAVFGPTFSNAVAFFDYSGISGPLSFGSGTMLNGGPTSGTGDLVGISFINNAISLFVPQNYISGSFLSNNDTYSGQSFSSLGLTSGHYVWTFGSGAHADSFTMNIGPQGTVPEPSSLVLMGIGGVAGLGYAWRRRRAQVVA